MKAAGTRWAWLVFYCSVKERSRCNVSILSSFRSSQRNLVLEVQVCVLPFGDLHEVLHLSMHIYSVRPTASRFYFYAHTTLVRGIQMSIVILCLSPFPDGQGIAAKSSLAIGLIPPNIRTLLETPPSLFFKSQELAKSQLFWVDHHCTALYP